jgi:hypothetical protein
MPCYTINTMTADFRAENRAILDRALTALGYACEGTDQIYLPEIDATLDLINHVITCEQRYLPKINALKREYSRQAITAAAQRKGWIVRQTTAGTTGQIIRY